MDSGITVLLLCLTSDFRIYRRVLHIKNINSIDPNMIDFPGEYLPHWWSLWRSATGEAGDRVVEVQFLDDYAVMDVQPTPNHEGG